MIFSPWKKHFLPRTLRSSSSLTPRFHVGWCGEGSVAGEHAGPDGDGISRSGRSWDGGPAAASAVLQPLPAFADDILYVHDMLLHVYIYIYIHTYIYIYIYIYYKYLHIGHMVMFQMLRLYTLILTITIKDTFWWENKMILNIKIQGEGSRSLSI